MHKVIYIRAQNMIWMDITNDESIADSRKRVLMKLPCGIIRPGSNYMFYFLEAIWMFQCHGMNKLSLLPCSMTASTAEFLRLSSWTSFNIVQGVFKSPRPP